MMGNSKPLESRLDGSERLSGYRVLRGGTLSILVALRPAIAVGFMAVLLWGIFCLSLVIGSGGISVVTAVQALFGHGDPMNVFLVRELRLDRSCYAILAGAALGIGGCLLRTLARNRLATPDTTGITAGATAFAIFAVLNAAFGKGGRAVLGPSEMSLVGALVAALLAFGLSRGTGTQGYRFIVVGIGLGEIFSSLTRFATARVDMDVANLVYPWSVGSLNLSSDAAAAKLAIALIILCPICLAIGQKLSVMRLDDAVAGALGINVPVLRIGVILVAVCLAALAISLAGPIGMVGLVAPELAKRLSGPQTVPWAAAALCGASFVLGADMIGRVAFDPIEVPVGLVTSAFGAPYLLFILLKPARGDRR
ncbi:iron ABC transporter permease [Thalassospira sp. MA62]|nr:iron ABC transporter permease [Thalassospira sp. MA62]